MPSDYGAAESVRVVVRKLFRRGAAASCDRCASLQACKELALCKLPHQASASDGLPEVNIDKHGMAKITTRGDGVWEL